MLRWGLALVVLGALEWLTRSGAIEPLTLPPPTEIVDTLASTVVTGQFLSDLLRTALTVAAAATAGCLVGAAFGALGWWLPALWRAIEPFLIALYAMPVIVFYPIVIVLLGGIGIWPIIIIAAVMAAIPMAINTAIALRSVPQTMFKLARSLNCTRIQAAREIVIPSAAPLAMPGVRLGFVYAMIGTVAMEFILADRGLGFRTGVAYRAFEVAEMWAMIVAVALLAITLNGLLSILERRVRRDIA
jgi:NitT/TauT family transport system permease protein